MHLCLTGAGIVLFYGFQKSPHGAGFKALISIKTHNKSR